MGIFLEAIAPHVTLVRLGNIGVLLQAHVLFVIKGISPYLAAQLVRLAMQAHFGIRRLEPVLHARRDTILELEVHRVQRVRQASIGIQVVHPVEAVLPVHTRKLERHHVNRVLLDTSQDLEVLIARHAQQDHFGIQYLLLVLFVGLDISRLPVFFLLAMMRF